MARHAAPPPPPSHCPARLAKLPPVSLAHLTSHHKRSESFTYTFQVQHQGWQVAARKCTPLSNSTGAQRGGAGCQTTAAACRARFRPHVPLLAVMITIPGQPRVTAAGPADPRARRRPSWAGRHAHAGCAGATAVATWPSALRCVTMLHRQVSEGQPWASWAASISGQGSSGSWRCPPASPPPQRPHQIDAARRWAWKASSTEGACYPSTSPQHPDPPPATQQHTRAAAAAHLRTPGRPGRQLPLPGAGAAAAACAQSRARGRNAGRRCEAVVGWQTDSSLWRPAWGATNSNYLLRRQEARPMRMCGGGCTAAAAGGQIAGLTCASARRGTGSGDSLLHLQAAANVRRRSLLGPAPQPSFPGVSAWRGTQLVQTARRQAPAGPPW